MHGKTRIQQIRDNMPSLGSLLAIDIVINSDSLSSRNVEFGLYCQVTGSWISPRGRMRAEGQFCCKKREKRMNLSLLLVVLLSLCFSNLEKGSDFIFKEVTVIVFAPGKIFFPGPPCLYLSYVFCGNVFFSFVFCLTIFR